MADREKVIEGLEWILSDDRFGFGVNWERGEPRDDYEKAGKMITDAIALLKGQEAVEPKTLEHKDGWIEYYCGNCKTYLFQNNAEIRSIIERPKYCSMCGQAVK